MAKFTLSIGLTRGSRFPEGPACVTVPEAIATLARLLKACGISGATLVPTFGYWEGSLESSIQVCIVTDDCLADDVAQNVADFTGFARTELRQDCILVEVSRCTTAVVAFSDTWDARQETFSRLLLNA